jgi:23S rRNA (guanosine2251-2'-O)-methyltransferase
VVRLWIYVLLSDSLTNMKIVILHNIRSHYNVGAIFRTCDGAGVGKVYLSGYTPTPTDRFGRAVPEIHKTALGAEQVIPWEVTQDLPALILGLQTEGVSVVAVEQSPESVKLPDYQFKTKTAFIFGSETEGINLEILKLVDEVLELPMLGEKESLNVSVTAGIVLYHT